VWVAALDGLGADEPFWQSAWGEQRHSSYSFEMANKAPPSGQSKKPGKSLKEKRAAKQEKKDLKARKGSV
jgi:hypothetical protein